MHIVHRCLLAKFCSAASVAISILQLTHPSSSLHGESDQQSCWANAGPHCLRNVLRKRGEGELEVPAQSQSAWQAASQHKGCSFAALVRASVSFPLAFQDMSLMFSSG